VNGNCVLIQKQFFKKMVILILFYHPCGEWFWLACEFKKKGNICFSGAFTWEYVWKSWRFANMEGSLCSQLG
jgi:hypothetical protein